MRLADIANVLILYAATTVEHILTVLCQVIPVWRCQADPGDDNPLIIRSLSMNAFEGHIYFPKTSKDLETTAWADTWQAATTGRQLVIVRFRIPPVQVLGESLKALLGGNRRRVIKVISCPINLEIV